MHKIVILFFILNFSVQSQAESVSVPASTVPSNAIGVSSQSPPTRPRIDDLQKESSSFVADPDPLDPLPLKKESLKEDEEPI